MDVATRGSYLGFDRFGIPLVSDEDRVKSLAAVIAAGAGDRVVISHDSVWCWKGNPFPADFAGPTGKLGPTLIDEQIIPKLLETGVSEAQIDALTHDNPRRYFEGQPLAELAR